MPSLLKDSEYFIDTFPSSLSHFSNHHSKKFCEIVLFIGHCHWLYSVILQLFNFEWPLTIPGSFTVMVVLPFLLLLLNRKKVSLNYLVCWSSVMKAKRFEREEGTTGDVRLMALNTSAVAATLCSPHSCHHSLVLLWRRNVLITFDSLILEVDSNFGCV